MSQDVNNDWQNRQFIEGVEVAVRKCVDFLNHFQESAQYRLSVVDQRLTSLERQLDFLEAQLTHCDPSKRGAKGVPFKSSIFDPSTRRVETQKKLDALRTKTRYTGRVIAPSKIVRGAGMNTVPIQQQKQKQASAQADARAQQQRREQADAQARAKAQAADQQKRAREEAARQKREAQAKADAQARAKAQAQAQQQKKQAAAVPPPQPPPPMAGGPPGSGGPPRPPPGPGSARPGPPPAAPGAPGSSQPGSSSQPGAQPGAGEPGSAGKFPHGRPKEIDYRVVIPGTGKTPQATSSVEIEYTGYLESGKQFIRHKEVIHMGQRQNIKGLEQGCQVCREGGSIKLWIPSKLGYGSRGAGSLIPPHANLTFELKLIKIHKY